MIQKKKYAKAAKIIPDGYESANHFFEAVFKDKEMIWMGQNTNELHIGHNDDVHKAMIDCIGSDEYCKYPPPEGFTELHSLILEDLELEGLSIGATESLYLAMNAVLSPEDNVITPDPGYLIIDNFASRFANEVRQVKIYSEENGYKLTPKLVSYTEDEIKEFAQIAMENDIYLIHDVTYRDFSYNHTLCAKYAPDHTITCYSFSKIFGMAGLRLGAIISSPDVIDVVKSIIINDVGTNMVAQAGAIAALKSKSEWIDRVRDTTFENQKIIKEAVDQCEGVFLPVYPSSANMMGIDLSGAGIDPEKMSSYLIEKKVFTRQGSYTSNTFGHNYLRVSYSIDPEKVKVFAREFVLAVEALRTK